MGKNKSKNKSKKQGNSSPAISPIISRLSKLMCLILSLGGYFNANNYSDFLDNFATESEIHDENDMDDVMNAMEFHEQHRTKLANILRALADAMADYISMDRKPGEDEIWLEYFQNVERCLSDAITEISLYQSLLVKQEEVILNFRCEMKNICKSNHPDLFPFQRYVLVFGELLKQYMKQIQWENECLNSLNTRLHDGSVYVHLNQDEELRMEGMHLQRNLKVWASGMEKCGMLDCELWLDAKQKVLEQFSICGESLGDDETMAESTLAIEIPDEINILCETFGQTVRHCCSSYHNIEDFSSIESIMDRFLSHAKFLGDSSEGRLERQPMDTGKPFLLLLTGPPGTGKTYICNQIAARIAVCNKGSNDESNVVVICPRFPADFVKPFVGGFEDSLLSLFSYATSICPLKKCVLLLDGVDELFVENVKNTTDTSRDHSRRYHLSFRTRNLFFDILDKLTRCNNHQECCSLSNLLVICTSKAAGENVRDRFHKVFHLGNPDETERKMILESCLQKPIGEMPEDVVNMLEELVADTVGKSRGDIAQHCRDAIDAVPGIINDSIEVFSSRLDVVKNSITTIMPASIKNITGEGFVDMKVSSARELTREFFNGSGNLVFPLFGDNAKYCWAQLENLIVSPLCRKKTLDRLLYGDCYHSSGSGERNPGNAGVLVTGPPGTGKSVIARYCAAYAASLDANIRLVEVPCTSLIHKELGSSEICVHKLFEAVRAAAPCILVLDGIENIAPVRGHDNTSEGTMDRLLSTLLIEMDGVSRVGKSNNDSGIAVIGITHNPISWIDPAMLRPGRLEKCIYMEKPCIVTRKKIFSDAIKELTIDFSGTGLFDPKDEEQLADAVAIMTHNKSAADVIALCNNAKIQALKRYLDDIDGAWKLKSSELSVSYYHFLGRSSK